MPVIVVTRLRLRDPALLTEFFTAGAAVLQQANKADGNLGADALGDANNAAKSSSVLSLVFVRTVRPSAQIVDHAGLAVSPEGLSWTTPRLCAEAAIRRMSPCYAG